MNIQRLIFWFMSVVVLVLLIILVLWHGRTKSVGIPMASQMSSVPTVIATNPSISVPFQSNAPTGTVANVPVASPTNTEQVERSQLSELNNEEIVFYGRVVDQFDAPVVGATVLGTIQVNNGTQVGADRMSVTTDMNGLFTVSGYRGKSLGIHVVKSGYIMATTKTSFTYSYLWPESQRYMPDQGNPTVIKMWKLQGAEPLVNIDKTYKLHYANTPINFDLVAGQIVPAGGDLQITVNRPDGIISQQHPQNWDIQISVMNGGLIETSFEESRVTYSAPTDGYQPTDTLENNNGPDLVDEMFFMQSRNGQVYSKFHLLFGINDLPDEMMSVTFNGIANTNGSGDWEATAPQ